MKNKKTTRILIICFVIALVIIGGVFGINLFLTEIIENSNIVCADQKFSSVEEAIEAMEISESKSADTDLDYCPPYSVEYTFEYADNTIVLYSYCYDYDGIECSDYAIRILKHNDDGTLSFDSGFADFRLSEPSLHNNYYYLTNIDTPKGTKSISFLYLPKDSDKEIYVDGVKAEKLLVSTDNEEFYICYAISNKDTFFSNLFTDISERHKVEIC